MSERLLCPYCNAWVDFETEEAFDEEYLYQADCGDCDKKFGVRASMSWNYYEEKVDCWNTGEHRWKNRVTAPREYAVGKQACEDCGEEREIDATEWEAIDADQSHLQNWRSEATS
ncbi:hypothetical protein G3I13_01885 [Streptomyces sp. SID6673]|nr:hypothetical protein [Streptomyces sp. SID11726]NDZ94911.1 hypothetical protein [Streptomyces sp. SID11726]NEB23071.1 hypothetical protein [Streptomyces sp. SID6673]